GIYTSLNGGEDWHPLKGGLPTISFRDLAIQERENDLVGASFGRGFYILDDYSPLREVTAENMKAEGHLFPIKDAWWYIPRPVLGFSGKGSQGAGHYVAPNPAFGATITYHLAKSYESLEETRKAAEKKRKEQGIAFPGWEALEQEQLQQKPAVYLVIKNQAGNVMRRIKAPAKKGIHRVAWDLRYPHTDGIRSTKLPDNPDRAPKGLLAAPGQYTATLVKLIDGQATELAGPQAFTVKRMQQGALPGSTPDATATFWRELEAINLDLSAVNMTIQQTQEQLKLMAIAVSRSQSAPGALDQQLHGLQSRLKTMRKQLNGDPLRSKVGEKSLPTIGGRANVAAMGTRNSTYGPTATHRQSLAIAQTQLTALKAELSQILEVEMPKLEQALKAVKAPSVKGSGLR
ncbi:MAG: glycosyl hydrolase, partial [Bacteroidota bacterium]